MIEVKPEPEVVLVDGTTIPRGLYELVLALVVSGHDVRVFDAAVSIDPPISDDVHGLLDDAWVEVQSVLRNAGAVRE